MPPRPRRYAEDTRVPAEQTRMEIERLLKQQGADGFLGGWDGDQALLAFRYQGRQIRILLSMPDRAASRTEAMHEQAARARWRALLLVIKAKIEAIQSGITTLDREFLADVVMADGRTVGQWAAPQIAHMYDTGHMPPLLPMPPEEP